MTTNNDVRHWPFNYEDTIKRRLAEYRIYEKSYDIITEDNNVQFTNIPKWLSIGKNPRHQQSPLPSAPFFATGFEWSKHFQIGIQWNSKNHPHQGINSHERMKTKPKTFRFPIGRAPRKPRVGWRHTSWFQSYACEICSRIIPLDQMRLNKPSEVKKIIDMLLFLTNIPLFTLDKYCLRFVYVCKYV